MKQGIFLTLSLFVVFLISCKKDTPESKPGSLLLHLHTNADVTEVGNYGDTIVLTGGRHLTVTTAQLYISNIKMIKPDGSVVDAPPTIVFMKQGIEEYEIGDVPSGNYKSVRYDVGLSEATNASTPATSDPILYQPSMWFEATAQPDGFVFVNFQGTIDTTNAANGTELIPFAYKIGTNVHRVTITMPDKNYAVIPDEQTVIHITVDYAKILDGIQLNLNENLDVSSAAQNTWPWVDQLETNIINMFTYEQ
jgi:hypothetical protein